VRLRDVMAGPYRVRIGWQFSYPLAIGTNPDTRKQIEACLGQDHRDQGAPAMLCRVLDWAIQAHGGVGVTEDFGLADAYAHARAMHLRRTRRRASQPGKLELRRHG
jgi:hypothetical protein